ncbi:MAG: nucleoside deaminase [Balneolaceae bacterium]|nr:MAG: nucleoside deaminase [Balneolaceae bacterium]
MQAAIDVARKGKTPFGAVLTMGDEIFAEAANQTKALNDPTAHAELLVIRKLAEHLQKTDLSGFTLYTTCEPCPMCMSAAIWANIDRVVFGCSIDTISGYMPQIRLKSHELAMLTTHKIEVIGNIMSEECEKLLKDFS